MFVLLSQEQVLQLVDNFEASLNKLYSINLFYTDMHNTPNHKPPQILKYIYIYLKHILF